MEISSEQTETERSSRGLQSKKRKLEETYIDTLTEILEKFKISKSSEEKNEQLGFFNSLAEAGMKLKHVLPGSIIMIIEFESFSALLCFGALYNSGVFKNMLTHGLVTEDYLASHGLSSVTLRLEVKKEDYLKCLEMMRQGKRCNISFSIPLCGVYSGCSLFIVCIIINNEDIKSIFDVNVFQILCQISVVLTILFGFNAVVSHLFTCIKMCHFIQIRILPDTVHHS